MLPRASGPESLVHQVTLQVACSDQSPEGGVNAEARSEEMSRVVV